MPAFSCKKKASTDACFFQKEPNIEPWFSNILATQSQNFLQYCVLEHFVDKTKQQFGDLFGRLTNFRENDGKKASHCAWFLF